MTIPMLVTRVADGAAVVTLNGHEGRNADDPTSCAACGGSELPLLAGPGGPPGWV